MKTIGTIRTALFVPATQAEEVDKAFRSGADMVIIDLEDTVARTLKAEARQAARKKVREYAQRKLMVRVNALGTPHHQKDLEAVVDASLRCVMLPKVESAEHIREFHERLLGCERSSGMAPGTLDLVVLIESARGVENIFQIMSETVQPARALVAAFGAVDYTLDLGIDLTRDGAELHFPRSRIAVACRAAGKEPPIDTPFLMDMKDLDALRADACRAKQLGFQGKMCIDSSQVGPCNEIFSPSAEEMSYARRVVEAFEKSEAAGIAALELDGKFIDYPVVERSRRIIRLGESISGV